MSKVRVSCPNCPSNYAVDEALVGKKGKCAKCGTKFVLAPTDAPLSGKHDGRAAAGSDEKVASPRQTRSFPTEDAVPADWQPGDLILDLYEVTDILGKGGMGQVYKVHHKGWKLDLAVKSPLPELVRKPETVENFVRECGTWVNLGMYPHTVSCYYVRGLGGIPRVFAEYVAGGDLEYWIKSGKLYEGGPHKALERILDIAIQFAWGLHFAHEQGLVHQDIKPANVMMTAEGIAKVTDFGLANARIAAESNPADVSQAKTLRVTGRGGTMAYWSPEQATAQAQAEAGVAREARTKITNRADIWGWATSVLEMFLGEPLWGRGNIADTWLEEAYPGIELESELPRIPDGVLGLLRQCLQRDPALRPSDMLAVASRLQEVYRECIGNALPREQPKPAELLADGLNNQALSLLDLGRHENAEHLFDKALQHDRHHPQATYNRGLLLWRAGRMTDDALIRQLREAWREQGQASHGQYLLACIHLERGDCESAIPLLEESLRAAPDDTEVVSALSIARTQLHASGRCLRTIEKLADDRSDWSHYDSSGRPVSFSPDGRLALSGSNDKKFRLWDVATARCLRAFEGHTRRVDDVTFSPDGRLALSGSMDTKLRLWNVASGKCLRTFEGHTGGVHSVSFFSDGRLALSGSEDKTLRLWELNTGRCVRTFEGHTSWVLSVSISRDGRLALSAGGHSLKCVDKSLRLWDVTTGRCLRTFEGHAHTVVSVSFSPDGRLALSGSKDHKLRLWNVATGECLRAFEGHTSEVNSVSFSPDGRLVLSGSDDQTLRLWEVATGRCLRTFEGHAHEVLSVSFSPDGRLALSSEDDTLRLWEVATGVPQRAIPCRPETSHALTQRASRRVALQGAANSRLLEGHPADAYRIIDEAMSLPGFARSPELIELRRQAGSRGRVVGLFAGSRRSTFKGHTDCVNSVSFSPDGRLALSGSDDKSVRLWDIATGQCLRTIDGHLVGVTSVSFSPDGKRAISGGEPPTLRVCDVATGHCIDEFVGQFTYFDEQQPAVASFSPDGRLAAISCPSHVPSEDGFTIDSTVEIWSVPIGFVSTCEGETGGAVSVSFSPDSRLALSGGRDEALLLWDVATGRCLRTFKGHTGSVASVSFSPDGRLALSGSWDSTLRLWDVATGRCLRTFEGHPASVVSASFSPDGRLALSGSSDGTLRLWDVAIGRCLRTFEGHTREVVSLSFSPDGRLALSASHDGTLRLWEFVWNYEFPEPADWDNGALPYLETFLYLKSLDEKGLPSRRPTCMEPDFQQLINELQFRGFGWLRPEGVKKKVQEMAANWTAPPNLSDS